MKGLLILLGSGMLATTLAWAQDMPANSAADKETEQSQQTTNSHTYQTSSGIIRGCLSGSAGNYTVTDQNGMQYTVNGPDNQLQASVGHEVEITTRQDQASATSTEGDKMTSSTTNSVQVSKIRDVATTCTAAHPNAASPMENQKSVPDAAESPQPQTMAMLQQEGASAPQQATPPVTSQTPATPQQSTDSAQQATPPASSTTTTSTTTTTTTGQQGTPSTSTNGMTGTQEDQNAQGARQGGMNTNPNAGSAAGTNPSAAPTTSATPSSNSAQQPNTNDQNKPLYERQATDIPWANHSGDNTGTTSTAPPSTTTTPPPQ